VRYYRGGEETQPICLSCCTNKLSGEIEREKIISDIKKLGVTLPITCETPHPNELCIDCGYSSLLETKRLSILTEWAECEGEYPKCPRCPGCYERHDRYLEELSRNIICPDCNREWDGQAQCPCGIYEYTDNQLTDNSENSVNSDNEDNEDNEDNYVYEGEYELEDGEIIENNTVKVENVKNTVKDIGEIMFDIQKDIPEGTYLELMDSLQKLTNEVNDL